jgi:hypothetical protein
MYKMYAQEWMTGIITTTAVFAMTFYKAKGGNMIEKVEIKNLKVAEHLSEETLAFSASVWINGKKAGHAKNSGRGGMTDVDLWDRKGEQVSRNNELHRELAEYVKQFTWESLDGKQAPYRVDFYIDRLVDDEYERQQIKRWCRTKTVFRISGKTYEEGQYEVMKGKFTKERAKGLRIQHGKDVLILNETL